MPPTVKVIDKGWNKIQKNAIKTGKGKVVSVGWQGTEAGINHGGMTNVGVAALMEYGNRDGTLPARPMYRQTFDNNKSSYEQELNQIVSGFFKGGTIDGQLLLLGERFKLDVNTMVNSNPFAPWAASTAAQKEREGKAGDVVLRNTGQMLDAMSAVIISYGSKS